MARGKKTDIETKAKIIESKINTDWSSRDIEEETGIPHETVAKVLREDFAQVCTESERIAELVDRNNRLQSLADKMIESKIVTGDEVIKISELVSLRQSTFTQNQLLKWKSTDNSNITIEWQV
jgi:cyanate lyase